MKSEVKQFQSSFKKLQSQITALTNAVQTLMQCMIDLETASLTIKVIPDGESNLLTPSPATTESGEPDKIIVPINKAIGRRKRKNIDLSTVPDDTKSIPTNDTDTEHAE